MSLKNALGGVALIAGTAIGAAVLALPVVTAHMGTIQTLAIYVTCWFFMTISAFYLLETNLFVGLGANLTSMADKTLGARGKYFTWVIYLCLLYALTAAYLAGAGDWIKQSLALFEIPCPTLGCALIATLLTVCIIVLGTAVTDWVNRFLMIGLIGAFLSLLGMAAPHVELQTLVASPAALDVRPIPLIITAFGSAIVIPTLTDYLHGRPRQLFYVVLLGSLIPLLVYIIWEIVILGILPATGEHGLLAIGQQGHPVVDIPLALQAKLQRPYITQAASAFSIFALATSLLGVSLSLFDFLADGLKLQKTFKNKLWLALVTFLPPLGFVLFYPLGFTIALSFAGLFVALLLGILPAIMVWSIRYRKHQAEPLEIRGGKFLLVGTILFFAIVIGIELFNQYVLHFAS